MKGPEIKPGTQFILLQPYPCKYCGKGFTDLRKLNKHRVMCYGMDMDYYCSKSPDEVEQYHLLKPRGAFGILQNCQEYECENCEQRVKFVTREGPKNE